MCTVSAISSSLHSYKRGTALPSALADEEAVTEGVGSLLGAMPLETSGAGIQTPEFAQNLYSSLLPYTLTYSVPGTSRSSLHMEAHLILMPTLYQVLLTTLDRWTSSPMFQTQK